MRTECVEQLCNADVELVWVDSPLSDQSDEVVFSVGNDALMQLVHVVVIHRVSDRSVGVDVLLDVDQRTAWGGRLRLHGFFDHVQRFAVG